MIDHHFTDNMVCPYCGCEQTDIYEIEGAYTEDSIRVECQECEKEFSSYCHITYSFCTETVDKEAEAREAAARKAEDEARREQMREKARQWPPGTPIKVRDDAPYAEFLTGRLGVVSNKELCYHGFVNVTLDPIEPGGRVYETFFNPEHLERMR